MVVDRINPEENENLKRYESNIQMYTYICVYMYIYVCIHIYLCICIYVYVYKCMVIDRINPEEHENLKR
jgi:hypothetical protein